MHVTGKPAILSWLLPDMAMVAACVTLFYCLFLFQGYSKLFRDSDAGWHIRDGEQILSTGSLPHADHYSFTRRGQPWFAWEWGSDVMVGAIHRVWGLAGVAVFYAAVIAAGVWLWFRLNWALEGNFFVACAMAPLLLCSENIHWLARPHLISWLFLLGTVYYCERRNGPFRWREAAAVFFVSAVWANLHASFFLGPAIVLIYAIGIAAKPYIWDKTSRQAGANAKCLLLAGFIAAAAPLANPYGYRLYLHVFHYLADADLLDRIAEYQSFNFHDAAALEIISMLIVATAGGTLSLLRRHPERFLLTVLITGMALRSARVLPVAALLLLPLANAAISESMAFTAGLNLRLRSWIDSFRAYSSGLRILDSRQSGMLLAPLAVAGCFGVLQAPGLRAATGFAPDQFPVAAYEYIPPAARLFAPDKFGGYLIYRSSGQFPVFFDGRSDLYGAEFLKQYGRVMQVRPGWQSWWNSFGFTHALLPADTPLLPALEQLGWRPVFQDGTATLLARTGT